ncbi:MAG: hypothetical protein FIB01_14010 [Gemmatimonadetes bacterium]|nr:hypothetical protein [Gemmatimonadota bacterium]
MISAETRELLAHLEWADAAVWQAALASPAAATDRRVKELLVHSQQTLGGYLQLWQGQALDLPEADGFPDLAAAAAWARDCHAGVAAYVAALDEAALERPIEFPWAEQLAERYGAVHPATLQQSIVQLALHSAYHRGQVNARLRELGAPPPLVDFIAWVWAGRSAPAWPAGSDR